VIATDGFGKAMPRSRLYAPSPPRLAARAAVFALSAVLATGCAGMRFTPPPDPLVLLGDGAALYAAVPVAPNRRLLDTVADSLERLEERDRASLKGILDRTSFARAAFYGDRSVRLVLSGDFPKSATPLVFSGSNGWKKAKDDAGAVWYENGTLSASIPASGIVCVTLGASMADMLGAASRDSPYPPVGAAFASLSSAPGAAAALAISVTDPASILPMALGADISLPVSRADIVATPEGAGETYSVELDFSAPDALRARALGRLLSLISGMDPEVAGTGVRMRKEGVSAETLAGFAGFLVF